MYNDAHAQARNSKQNSRLGFNQSEKIILCPSLRSRLKYHIYIFKRAKTRFQPKHHGSKVSPHICVCDAKQAIDMTANCCKTFCQRNAKDWELIVVEITTTL